MKELFGALSKAIAAAKAVTKESHNAFHRYDYASAESILEEVRGILAIHGLAVLPLSQRLERRDDTDRVVTDCLLTHESGQAKEVTYEFPVVVDKGRPIDKAYSAASTQGLAYYLRNLLLLPREDKAHAVDARDDRPPPVKAAAPSPASVALASDIAKAQTAEDFANIALRAEAAWRERAISATERADLRAKFGAARERLGRVAS